MSVKECLTCLTDPDESQWKISQTCKKQMTTTLNELSTLRFYEFEEQCATI